jgi:hypothetical protein
MTSACTQSASLPELKVREKRNVFSWTHQAGYFSEGDLTNLLRAQLMSQVYIALPSIVVLL